MKMLNLFIKLMFFTVFALFIFLAGRLSAAEGTVDYSVVADAGFTLLEQILIFTGISGGGLALVLIRIARKGVKDVLKSLDSNPYVDNRQLLIHAKRTGDKKVAKLFKAIEDS